MGFLKKIFKPVSKVLDKIIPNEIKPFLPFAAAAVPFLAPTAGIFGSVAGRAALSGGANIFSQLSQEGNEGDINLLSAGLGALSGAMTAPGFKSGLERFRPTSANEMLSYGESAANLKPSSFLDKATNVGIDYLGKGSDFMQAPGLTKYGIPAAQGTMDNMYAQAKRDQDAYDDMMSEDSEGGYTDDAYRAAIRKSMEAYGASEEEILRAIEAAGYKTGGRVGFKYGGGDIDLLEKMQEMVIAEPFKREEGYMEEEINIEDLPVIKEPSEYEPIESDKIDNYLQLLDFTEGKTQPFSKYADPDNRGFKKGGRVGLRFGGIGAAINQIDNQEMKEAAKFASMLNDMDVPIADLAEEFEIQFKRKPNSLEELKQFYKDRYDYKGPGDVKMKEEIKEKVVMGAKDGGLMNLGGKEMDLRGGGFVPIGKKERADDVPARLSKNEFVMTADAVRAAGGGSVNKGAKRMYDVMNKLEARA
jgi:hypothetical protein